MLVRATVHTCGLVPGQTGERNGNDKSVRASLAAGYLVRVDEVEDAPPPFAVSQTDDDPEPLGEGAAEGEPDQDD